MKAAKGIVSMLVIASLAGLSGCATIFCGGNEKIAFTSKPVGAHVEVIDGDNKTVASGTTPCNLKVARGDGYFRPASYTVRATADGYSTKTMALNPNLNGWYFGNIFLGGAIGLLIVDPLTGAMYSFPDTQIAMTPASTTMPSDMPTASGSVMP